jgi:vacuolar-type H+-ATPase subunit H
MNTILQAIIESEEEASKLENDAKQQALLILTEARKKASEILEKSLLEGEALSEELLQKAREEAEEEARLQADSKNKALEQIRLKAKERLNEAADYIVERIVN